MESIITLNGEKIDTSKLSDEQLQELYEKVQKRENLLKAKIDEYREKYPFLEDEDIGEER